MYSIVDCPDIVVAAAATDSPVVKAREVYNDADFILLFAPTGAEASTLQVTDDPDAAAPTYYDYTGDTDAALVGPAAAKAKMFKIPAFGFRIHFAAGVAAERTFKMQKVIQLGGSKY